MDFKADKFSLIIQYCDIENKKEISVDDLKKLFVAEEGFKNYAFILHDKDTNENGVLKTPHYHVYVETYNVYNSKTVRKFICKKLLINDKIVSNKPIEDLRACVRYLTHADNTDKYHYLENDIITNNPFHYDDLFNYGDTKNVDIVNLIDLVQSSESLSQIYSSLGLQQSIKCRNIINDMWKEYHR